MVQTSENRRVRLNRWLPIAALAVVPVVWLVTNLVVSDTDAMEPPAYVEEAAAAGLDHVYDGDFRFFVGGGVAVFDCDDDLKPDLYLAGGSEPAALYRNESAVGGALSFSPLSDTTTDMASVVGAYPVDIDSDGVVDLAVLRLGENVLLRGIGNCKFERANELWHFDGGEAWTTGFSAKWEAAAALPTLAFGNYLNVDSSGSQQEGCPANDLYRPSDEPAYGSATPLSPGWCSLSILFSDWDHSGHSDLRITNDRQYYRDGEEQLWRVDPGQSPSLYTAADGWPQLQVNGMGIASNDVTGDGLPEFFLTSMGDNKLQTLSDNTGEPLFADIALRSGVTAHRPFVGDDTLPSTAWHAEFQDVNNDSYVDLFVTKGNVDEMTEFAAQDPDNLLLGQPDGTFVESAVLAGLLSTGRSRGAAVADFNLDGMLDVIEVNRRDNVKLWRNVGWGSVDSPKQMGNWLAVRLDQVGPNSDGIGSWIEVQIGDRTVWREVTIGGGHASGQLGWIHIGVGAEDEVEVRVEWPDGKVGPWITAEANNFVVIERNSPEAKVAFTPER